MKFTIYDKYILDYLQKTIKDLMSYYKTAIKNDYIDFEKICNDSPTINNDTALNYLKTQKDFVAGVDFFDNKKKDFYLLSNKGITIPISLKNTIAIDDKKALANELFKKGYIDALELTIKSKDEILSNDYIRSKYAIHKDDSSIEIAKSISALSPFKIKTSPNNFFKQKILKDADFNYVMSNTNDFVKHLYSTINSYIIEEGEAIDILKENGFLDFRKLSKHQETIKELLSTLNFDLTKTILYKEIESYQFEMNKCNFDLKTYEENPFLKITFNEKKLMGILKNDYIENAQIIPGGIIKINKPIKTISEYENFLKLEEYIKKSTYKKIDMNLYNIPTLDDIFEKEFHMTQ